MRPYYHQENEDYEPRPQFRFGFGGGWTPAMKKIIILTGACFVLQLLLQGGPGGIWLLEHFALRCETVLRGQIWQLVTYALLHGGLRHIFWNMFIFWMLGTEVERVLGTQRFIALYVLSGIAAGICSCIFDPSGSPIIGASGCVLGILVAFGTLFPHRVITFLLFFMIPIRMQARTLVIGCTVLVLLVGSSGEPGIAHFAHLGGLAFGYLFIRTRPWWELFLRGVGRPRAEEPEEGVTVEDEVEMDRLLEKIKGEGLHMLSWREKRFLDRISQRLRDR